MRITSTPEASPKVEDRSNFGTCCAVIAVAVLLCFAAVLFKPSSPSQDSLDSPTVAESPVVLSDEATLAQVDYGVTPDAATLQKYAAMLDRLDKAFPEDRHQIAVSLLNSYPKIKENDPTLTSILAYGNLMANVLPEQIQKANRAAKKRRVK